MSHNNEYLKIPIKGMHCRSCELLIEDKLQAVPRVKDAEIDYKTGEAIVHYDGNAPEMHLLNKAIVEAGYEVGQPDKLPLLTRDKREYASLGVAFLFLMALFLVLKGFGLTNISITPDLNNPSWSLIILVGLVAGFSTCMALVGGLCLGLSAKFAENHPTATPSEKFRPHLFFVVGRILAYLVLGGLLGALGTVFQFSATSNAILTVLVGIVMLIMGLQLINIFPRLNGWKLALPKSIGRVLGLSRQHKEYSHKNAMIMGGLTFFLPCGFTQAMQLYAISTGDFRSGALIMGLFALGTAPGLLSIGGVTSLVRGSFKEKFFKVAGLAVIGFALFNLNNGYTLASLSLGNFGGNLQQSKIVTDPNVTMVNGVQVVRMTEGNSGYSPNKFSIKKGVPVKWIINAEAPYSCASTIMVPKLKIQKSLVAGENIIEFTPTETGKLAFSCSMGMYTGAFNVYDGDASPASASTDTGAVASNSGASCNIGGSASGGGGCGGGGAKAGGCGCGGGGGGGCGGGQAKPINTNTASAVVQGSVQVIKTTYTSAKYLDPAIFKVKAGVKVRLQIDVKDSGSGCGNAITIDQLYNQAEPLVAGSPITMEFTPTTPGTYDITCGMGMIRFGSITVE